MIARLRPLNSIDSTSVVALTSLPMTLGSGASADVRVVDQCASRLHCRIFKADNQIVVQDLGSTWGTLVNGRIVHESRLNPGDTLTVGLSNFCIDVSPSATRLFLGQLASSIKIKLESMFRVVDELLRD